MSYQVIARKWRPQTFEEVTGQEAITRTLRNAVEHDRLHHAYIFSGARGVGKTTTARLLAKSLNCHKTDKPNPTPCTPSDADACASCKEIAEGRSIDVLEFDAASHTGVDDIRELIIESININPARDRFKVFIIDEVHMLSNSSFNALLKTLEEPPPNVVFVMATTELHKVPDTILSRCQEFQFRTIPLQKIFDRLKMIAEAENINIADGALREIARSGEGSMRDAQSNFDQVISFSGENIEINEVISALGIASIEMLVRVVRAVSENKPSEALLVVDELIARGQDLRSFCRDLLSLFRDLLMVRIAPDAEHLFDSALMSAEEMRKLAEPFSEADFIRFFNSLSETESSLRDATQPRYVLEIGLVKLIEMRRVFPVETLLERIAKLESAISNGSLPPSEPAAEKPIERTAAPPAVEKKKLTVDFPLDEVPFPVRERSAAEPQIPVRENAPETTPEKTNLPDETEAESKPEDKPEPAHLIQTDDRAFNERISALIPDASTVKLTPIASEDLEHIEDNWLDAAYESRLLMEGDDLYPIKNASKLIEFLIGDSSKDEVSVTIETSSGSASSSAAAAVRARENPIFAPPEFEDEDSDEIPDLPENPTEEELWQYAAKHPVTRRVIRIFRGKLVEVKKL